MDASLMASIIMGTMMGTRTLDSTLSALARISWLGSWRQGDRHDAKQQQSAVWSLLFPINQAGSQSCKPCNIFIIALIRETMHAEYVTRQGQTKQGWRNLARATQPKPFFNSKRSTRRSRHGEPPTSQF